MHFSAVVFVRNYRCAFTAVQYCDFFLIFEIWFLFRAVSYRNSLLSAVLARFVSPAHFSVVTQVRLVPKSKLFGIDVVPLLIPDAFSIIQPAASNYCMFSVVSVVFLGSHVRCYPVLAACRTFTNC